MRQAASRAAFSQTSTGSPQRDAAVRQQAREGIAGEIGVLAFADIRHRVEPSEDVVDEAGMTHDETAIWQAFEEMPHQLAEIGRLREIIGAGEAGIEAEARAAGTAAELRAEDIEHHGFG